MVLCAVAAAGCSEQGAPVQGRVLIEGEPTNRGELRFYPIEGGPQAGAYVGQDGSFSLVSEGDVDGAMPGQYTVRLTQPLDDAAAAEVRKSRAGDPDDMRLTFALPKTQPVTIPAEGNPNLEIDIREEDGWVYSLSD